MFWTVFLLTMNLRAHCLIAILFIYLIFGVWLGLVALYEPLAHPVLYPLTYSLDAIPKYLSRKTSYLQP